jgi:hypothetical protein
MELFFQKKKLLLIFPIAYICISKNWGYVKTSKDLQGASVCMCLHVLYGGVCKVQKLVDPPYRSLIDLEEASSVCLVGLPHTYRSLKRCREQRSWCIWLCIWEANALLQKNGSMLSDVPAVMM